MVKKGKVPFSVEYNLDGVREFVVEFEPIEPDSYLIYGDLEQEMDRVLIQQHIYDEVTMAYIEINPFDSTKQMRQINSQFSICVREIVEEYGGTFVVLLISQFRQINEELDRIEAKIQEIYQEIDDYEQNRTSAMQQKAATVLNEIIENLRQSRENTEDQVIDFGMVFCQPLNSVETHQGKPKMRILDGSKCYKELRRLKSALYSSFQTQYTIKAAIGQESSLMQLLNESPKMLFLYCATGFADNKLGQRKPCIFLQDSSGSQFILTPQKIHDILVSGDIDEPPQIIVVGGQASYQIGKAFIQSGIQYVIVLQCYEPSDDTTVQSFLQTFILMLTRGQSIIKSFDDSLKATTNEKSSKQINTSICCCFHHQHEPNCKTKELEKEIGLLRIHQLYHVPSASCKCPKRLQGVHKYSCLWAKEALFQINRKFSKVEEDGEVRRLFPYEINDFIRNNELVICCCETTEDMIKHKEQKIKILKNANAKEEDSLFYRQEELDPEGDSDIIDRTPACMLKQQYRIDRMYGRNEEVFKLTKEFMDMKTNRVMVYYGPVGSGRTSVVSKTMSYMVQRSLLDQDIFYLNMNNCNKKADFQFKFCRKTRMMKNYQADEIKNYFGDRPFLLIMDNCDSFVTSSYDEFIGEMKWLLELIQKIKIVMVISQATERKFANFLLGEKRVPLSPLDKYAATDMFLMQAKDVLPPKDINLQNIWNIFSDPNLCYPKTIQDMVFYLKKLQVQKKTVSLASLQMQAQKTKKDFEDSERFLKDNLVNLKQDVEAYRLFLLIAQFESGLSEHDFQIMSHQASGQSGFSFVDSNWRQIISRLLSVGSTSEENQDKIEQGQYYFCIVQKKYNEFFKIRVKKYILLFMANQEMLEQEDAPFKAVVYFSHFSTVLLNLVKQKKSSHEQLMEHTNLSRCGFFQFEKNHIYAEFFDPHDYYPGRATNMTRSIYKGMEIDEEMREVFILNKKVKELEPHRQILQHQENFIALYHKDYENYQQKMSSQMRKLFKYYYENILLNIPTLVRLILPYTSRSFLLYCIEESHKKLRKQPLSPSIKMLLVKLALMRLDYDLKVEPVMHLRSHLPIINQILALLNTNTIRQDTQNIIGDLTKIQCSDELQMIAKFEVLLIAVMSRINSLTAQNSLTTQNKADIIDDIFKLLLRFNLDYSITTHRSLNSFDSMSKIKLKSQKGLNILWAKSRIITYDLYFKYVIKNKASLEQFSKIATPSRIKEELEKAITILKAEELYYLQLEAVLLLVRLKLRVLEFVSIGQNIQSNPSNITIIDQLPSFNSVFDLMKHEIGISPQSTDIEQQIVKCYLHIFQEHIKPSRRLMEVMINKEKETEINNLEGIINKRIWDATKNVIVLMRSNPILSAQGEPIMINGIKRSSNLKYMMEEAVVKKLQEENAEKEIFVRFQQLTLDNFTDVINLGCSILMMYVNVYKDEQGNLVLQMEDNGKPVEILVTIKEAFQKISLATVELLVLIGQGVDMLASGIESKFEDTVLIVTLNYEKFHIFAKEKKYDMEEKYLSDYYEYSIKTLQKIVAAEFFRLMCQKILSEMNPVKNTEIELIFNSSKEGALIYAMGFSKEIANRQDFQKLIKIEMHNLKKKPAFELHFQKGQYHNVSQNNSNLHNITRSTLSFVGRQELIVEILEFLQDQGRMGKPCFINLYGAKSRGKSVLLQECMKTLVERGHFPTGVYLINGRVIESSYAGNIEEYLYKMKKQIFQLSDLEKKSFIGEQLLILIDDFHLIKQKRQYISKFLILLNSKKVNLIVTTRQRIEEIPEMPNHQIFSREIPKLRQNEAAQLSYTFIPLYDFNSYCKAFQQTFDSLNKTYEDDMVPTLVINEYKKYERAALKAFSKEMDKYRSYSEYLDYFLGQKLKKYKKSASKETEVMLLKNTRKKSSNAEQTPKYLLDSRDKLQDSRQLLAPPEIRYSESTEPSITFKFRTPNRDRP